MDVTLLRPTLHLIALTNTPASFERFKASVNSLSVFTFGLKLFASERKITKRIARLYPSLVSLIRAFRCATPRFVGASGKRAILFSTSVTDFTSTSVFFPLPPVSKRSNRWRPIVCSRLTSAQLPSRQPDPQSSAARALGVVESMQTHRLLYQTERRVQAVFLSGLSDFETIAFLPGVISSVSLPELGMCAKTLAPFIDTSQRNRLIFLTTNASTGLSQ